MKSSGLRGVLALKGGTAIRKVYFPGTWRFSEDLDFTRITGICAEGISESMRNVFLSLRRESGIDFSLESYHPTAGAIIANVQFIGPLNFPNRIKHDITLKEKLVLEPRWIPLRTRFSDLPEFEVFVYTLDEILVEKIRSIMQRGYSRDYYDVWRLLKEGRFKDSEIRRLLVKKCELSGIEYQPNLLFDKTRLSEADSFWVKGLGYLTKELPKFNTVISELRDMLSFLN